MPAENILRKQRFEIPAEWVDIRYKNKTNMHLAKNFKGLSIFDNNKKIKKDVKNVLSAIKECGAILATGHISWQESQTLVSVAVQNGLKKIIITHPIYKRIAMPPEIQKKLAEPGVFIEHCFSMYSIDNVPVKKIANQIKRVGAEKCILSSDVGQTFSKSPSEALLKFSSLLGGEGLTEKELRIMLIKNPMSLLRQ